MGPLLSEPKLVPRIHPREMYKLAREVDSEDADAIFISCTGLHVSSIIDILEKDLEKPVITSNQVMIWDALKKLKVNKI